MEGTIAGLTRYPEKRQPGVKEQELHLLSDIGIEGDFHGDGSNNQISILTREAKTWMELQSVKGHCFLRFKENILVQDVSLADCRPGDQMVCEGVVLEFSDFEKRCHADICPLAGAGISCILADHIRYAVVRTGGLLRNGMKITIKRKNENIE